MANLVISVFSAIIIFVIAWLSYRFYERYFLNIKKKFTWVCRFRIFIVSSLCPEGCRGNINHFKKDISFIKI
jgi:peptidoglycan/LPS O-acetylase OafA/YrhL